MHPSYYKRPLFLLLLAYACLLLIFKPGISRKTPENDVSFFAPADYAVVEGEVEGYPQKRRGRIEFVLKAVRFNGIPAAGRVLVRAPDGTAADWMEKVRAEGRLFIPEEAAIPGNLDWKNFLAKKGIRCELYASGLERAAPAPAAPRAFSRLRSRILGTFNSSFPPEKAAILSGIVLGEKNSIPRELYRAFQDSGAMHLLVASGSNVGFVTLLVYFIFSRLGCGRRACGLWALALAGVYVLCAGPDAPLIRAYVMSAAAMAGYLLSRESGVFQGLVLACLGILAVSPDSLFQPGFQMSFLATFGIVAGMSFWKLPSELNRFWKAAVAIAMVSFFAQSALYPVMAFYFHRISAVSLVSNLFLVPLSAVLMGLGFLTALTGGLSLPFHPVSVSVTALALELFQRLVEFFARLPLSGVSVPPPGFGTLAAYYCAAGLVWHLPDRRFIGKIWKPALGTALLAVLLQHALPGRSRGWVFSRNGSSSILLATASGKRVLLNAGMDGAALASAVLNSGSRSLDILLLSSSGMENWNGMDELSGRIRIKKVAVPPGPVAPGLRAGLDRMKSGGSQILNPWPGEPALSGNPSATLSWPAEKGRGGRIRRICGYSGLGGFSWIIESDGRKMETGADASFLLMEREGEKGEFDIISHDGKLREISF
ncbi:MAG: ComEC/Rec2 family competence protein [bacterium]